MTWEAFTARVGALASDAARLAEGAVLATLVPGLEIDPWLATLVISQLLDEMEPDEQPAWRLAPLERWMPRIRARLDAWASAPSPLAAEVRQIVGARFQLPAPPAAEAEASSGLPGLPPAEAPAPEAPVIAKPTVAVEVAVPEGDESTPPPTGASESTAIIPAPPPGLPEATREAWIQARLRAGEYIRGLGNRISAFTPAVTREQWDGETPEAVPDPEARREKLDVVRRRVADAVAHGQGPAQLTSELGNAIREWSRDWKRIARTELQGVRNEGAVVYAFRTWGEDARVCRVPQRGACEHCLRLFLEPNGWPRVFTVRELVANGVNVGRKTSDWLATAYPVHPNCRCDVVVLPPRMRLNAQLELVPA